MMCPNPPRADDDIECPSAGGTLPTVDFMGLPLARATTQEFMGWVIANAHARRERKGTPIFVTYLNAWCSIIAERDRQYRELLMKSDCLYADGMAIVWASRVFRHPVAERINAGDFILDFCRRCAAENLSVFLVGGRAGVAERAARSWSSAVPGLRIAGYAAGYFETDAALKNAFAEIQRTQPDIVLVGMGVPHQEKWVATNIEHLSGAGVCWCVGALFEYFGEARMRAPIWVRQIGMEWAFRLALEPRRLATRYICGNTQFVYNVLRHKLKMSVE